MPSVVRCIYECPSNTSADSDPKEFSLRKGKKRESTVVFPRGFSYKTFVLFYLRIMYCEIGDERIRAPTHKNCFRRKRAPWKVTFCLIESV